MSEDTAEVQGQAYNANLETDINVRVAPASVNEQNSSKMRGEGSNLTLTKEQRVI